MSFKMPPAANVSLSVIIPTYMRKRILREMLEGLAQQTLPHDDFEVIVVVDGSPDDTCDMLQALRVPYALRSAWQENAGAAAARNHAARLARGNVLVFLDDDLLPRPELLEEHQRFHEQDPNAVVLGRLFKEEHPAAEGAGGWNWWDMQVLERHYRALQDGSKLPAGRRLYSANFSISKGLFCRAGGFDEHLLRGEDVELGFRLEACGAVFYFNNAAAAVHRGYRSFESWCNSAYLYGQSDLQLDTLRGYSVIPEVLGWYQRQRLVARAVLSLLIGRPRLQRTAVHGAEAVSAALTRRGLHRLAHLGYGAIFKMQYWQGFVDEMGGRKTFGRYLKDSRREERTLAPEPLMPGNQKRPQLRLIDRSVREAGIIPTLPTDGDEEISRPERTDRVSRKAALTPNVR